MQYRNFKKPAAAGFFVSHPAEEAAGLFMNILS
jgi:hypothetical protein